MYKEGNADNELLCQKFSLKVSFFNYKESVKVQDE